MRRATFLAGLAWFGLVAGAAAEEPSIARPGLPRAGISAAAATGVVFFLKAGVPPGVVAVGTAHTLALEDLVRAGRVDFVRAGSLGGLTHSTRFAVPPGQPFSRPEATLSDDYVVFRLARAPRGVRALESHAGARLSAGARVRLLGPPDGGRAEQQDAFGTVVAATAERIEIDLDLDRRLEGWGGVPVLSSESDRVVGLVEAAVPGAGTTRVLAARIDGVVSALRKPLDAGAGRAFSAFARTAGGTPIEPSPPQPEPADDGRGRALIDPLAGDATSLQLSVEFPPDGAEVASTVCGTFVAGRAIATRGTPRRFDVILVIDTSHSTAEPAGTDVNGNGEVGETRLGRLGSIFGAGSTDPGDSILAAEVAAARQVLVGLDPRSTRVGLIAFAGDPFAGTGRASRRKPAFTVEGLTRDYARIELGLDELLATPPEGSTHMAAGVDQATIELMGLRGAYSKPDPDSDKVVFFFTDGQPTQPYGPDAEADNVRAVLRAANRASRGHIRIHSFAIGPEALEGPIAPVEMARRTRGYFTPVRHPGDLVDVVEDVSFADIRQVRLEHGGTHAEAEPFRLTADGSWAGFVQLEPGENPIHVSALAEDGASQERRIRVSLVDEAPPDGPALPPELVPQRNRLLEDCLLIAKQRRLQREQDRNDEIRRKLRLEIERERQRARRRAAEQRKALDLEAEIEE